MSVFPYRLRQLWPVVPMYACMLAAEFWLTENLFILKALLLLITGLLYGVARAWAFNPSCSDAVSAMSHT